MLDLKLMLAKPGLSLEDLGRPGLHPVEVRAPLACQESRLCCRQPNPHLMGPLRLPFGGWGPAWLPAMAGFLFCVQVTFFFTSKWPFLCELLDCITRVIYLFILNEFFFFLVTLGF
jgi:hypothetical protein